MRAVLKQFKSVHGNVVFRVIMQISVQVNEGPLDPGCYSAWRGFFSEIVGSDTNRPLRAGLYRCTPCTITRFLAFAGRTVELSAA